MARKIRNVALAAVSLAAIVLAGAANWPKP